MTKSITELLDEAADQLAEFEKKEMEIKLNCAPCPITGNPCRTRGDMGDIPYYYYPGDFHEYSVCVILCLSEISLDFCCFIDFD